ncbi:MAG: acriflavin resistance protein, partial [Devosia sp.]|nr:acriflavin resistance protein [Devosia sp.]
MTDAAASIRPRRRLSFEWLGVAPFIIFAVMFLILPTLYLIGAAFVGRDGQFTFDNIAGLFTEQIMAAYWISIRISGASAILGALIGLAIALALIRGRLPAGLRSAVMTFSGVASNFAGVP